MNLSELADKHGSDKNRAGHNYIPAYTFWLKDRQVDSLLEVGFGAGTSPRMWREYYPNADLYVIELFGEEFENTWHSPQTDNIGVNIIAGDATLQETWDKIPNNLDVIIDDGSHIPWQQIATFDISFKKLKSKGLYIIEDAYCNYDPDYSDHDVLFPWLSSMIVKQQSSNLTFLSRDFYTNRNFMEYPICDIYSYHIYKGFIVFEKA